MRQPATLLLIAILAGCADESGAPMKSAGEAEAVDVIPIEVTPVDVTLSDGTTVSGQHSERDGISGFLGIPFAAPPVGDRRFGPPGPPARQAAIDATAFRPACMQGTHMFDWYRDLVADFGGDPAAFPLPELSEDCLYLNVWTPRARPGAALPVIVWIHGGSHRGGWSYEPNYIGGRLAAEGAVVVSIAYRLDVFGFIAHDAFDAANPGLLDQVEALRWIRRNVEAFGGDPDNVTVAGESAGGASVGYLLQMPAARGLFRRAIVQSAGYQLLNDDRRDEFAGAWQAAGAPFDGSDREALQRAPAHDWLAAAETAYADYRPDVYVDAGTVSKPPAAALAAGELAVVDLLVGSNADEWRMYVDPDSSDADVEAWLADHAPAAAALLRERLGTDPVRNLDRLRTAQQYVCPSMQLAGHMREHGANVYMYYFSRVRESGRARELGAYHGAELPYLFGTHDDWLPTADADRTLSAAMMRYWVNFARDGNPNGDGLLAWPLFDNGTRSIMRLDAPLQTIAHPEHPLCEVLAPDVANRGT